MNSPASMTPERWQRLQTLFDRAMSLDPEPRAQFIATECGSDQALREQLLSLIMASSSDDAHFESRVEKAIATTLGHDTELQSGHRVGPYRVVRLIGRGGMGAVYLAERADREFEQRVAVKIVADGALSARIVACLRSERQILANLNHPNIARLLDGGATGEGTPYLAMEYVEGQRIDYYCEEQQLDIRQRLELFQRVCAAVQYAHQNLIVHRDIKPSNILVTSDGVPKLLDFGIAKLLDPNATQQNVALTRVHERVLTPEHASPEQVRGETVGTVSDIYALGVLLYELLTGQKPYNFSGFSLAQIEQAICEQAPQRPSAALLTSRRPELRALARTLEGDLDTIVMKAMHKEPARRYGSAGALSDDIGNYLDERPILARRDSVRYRAAKFWRRNRWAVTSGVAIAIAIVVLTGFYTWRLTIERDTARRERQTAAAVSDFMQRVFSVADPSESRGNSVTVREVLDTAVARIDTELQSEPRVRATLLKTMGSVYDHLGLWKQAETLLERAVTQERQTFGNEHLELSETLASLASTEYVLNNFERAEQLYREAWQIREILGLDRDAGAAELLGAQAGVFRAQQRFDRALEFHLRAVDLARAQPKIDPHLVGSVLESLAMTQTLTGDFERAERNARDAQAQLRVMPGFDMDSSYLNAVNTHAEALRRLYRFDEAEAMQRKVLAIQEKRVGHDTPLVGRTLNNLSHILRARGAYKEAEDALLEAIAIYGRQPGGAEFDAATSNHNLGGLRREAGDLSGAWEALEKALAIRRKILGEESPYLVATLLEEETILRARGDLAAAERVFARAQSIASKTFSPKDPRRMTLQMEEARFRAARGDLSGALEQLRTAIAKLDPKDLGRMAGARLMLGDVLLEKGDAREAAAQFAEALAMRKKIMPPDHWMIADVESLLGSALARSGNKEEGESLLRSSLAKLERLRPTGDLELSRARSRLADFERTKI